MIEADPAEEIDPGPPRPKTRADHDSYAALRERDYRFYLISSILSTIGGEMLLVAVGWELYARTHSPLALGWVGLVLGLPVVALALPAGHLADRMSRRQIARVAHLVMALGASGLAAVSFGRGAVGWIYLFLFVTGCASAYSMPAKWALVPQLVPKGALANAMTWNSTGWQVASVVGPALGGLILGIAHGGSGPAHEASRAGWAYALDAALFLIVFGTISAIAERPPVGEAVGKMSRESLLVGLRFVRRTPLILATITMDMLAVLVGGATALLPIYASDILRVGPEGLGWLRAAQSAGAFGMALALAHRPPLRRAGPSLLWAVVGFGVATIVFGFSRNYALSLAMMVLMGALDNISVVVRSTLLQVLTPDAMRGRVSAVNGIFISTSNELGSFESGIAAWLLGPVVAVVAGGVGAILVVAGVAAIWPQVGRLGSLEKAGREVEGVLV